MSTAPYQYTAADVQAAEFQAVRGVLEGHPVVAALSWDEQNSLAQHVLDALEPWLLDDTDEEQVQLKALAEARHQVAALQAELTKAKKAAVAAATPGSTA